MPLGHAPGKAAAPIASEPEDLSTPRRPTAGATVTTAGLAIRAARQQGAAHGTEPRRPRPAAACPPDPRPRRAARLGDDRRRQPPPHVPRARRRPRRRRVRRPVLPPAA